MPGIHFPAALTEAELAALADTAVEDMARSLTRRVFGPPPDQDGTPCTAGSVNEQERWRLAYLHVLAHVCRAVQCETDRAAAHAAGAGAGYPQLGQACNMSRQGARRRWPGLVTSATRRRTSHSLAEWNR